MKPHVAVCVPSMGTWRSQTGMAISSLCVHSMNQGVLGCLISEEGSLIAYARNNIVRRALSFSDNISHILQIDSDMTFPQDSLVRLLAHNKDIVGAFGRRRVWPFDFVGEFADPVISSGNLRLAKHMPGAFVLVKRRVYETIKTPWYFHSYEGGDIGEDIGFSTKAKEAGFEAWCDTSLTAQLGHIGEFVVPGDLSQAEFLQPLLPGQS